MCIIYAHHAIIIHTLRSIRLKVQFNYFRSVEKYVKRYAFIALLILCSCNNGQNKNAGSSQDTVSCKGIYYSRNAQGNLLKFNQYWQEDQQACLTDNMPLSQWEKTSEAWDKNNVLCSPQPYFLSRSLIAANNYYAYRDGKVYLDFDASTGIYRRIILGEDKNGRPVFTRSKGCFYQKTGIGVDAGFGNQLLLDTVSAKFATSENFDPMEIFRYDETETTLNMTRFDDSDNGWDFKFCPYLETPWEFCTLLRDGNIMYWPITLTNVQQNDLLNEAILVRKQFNYSTISNSSFEIIWETIEKSRTEVSRDDWKYNVIILPDIPSYIDAAWRDYLIGARPTMPNVQSNTMPSICYQGSKIVILPSGNTGKIYGEICYSDGIYSFTSQ